MKCFIILIQSKLYINLLGNTSATWNYISATKIVSHPRRGEEVRSRIYHQPNKYVTFDILIIRLEKYSQR